MFKLMSLDIGLHKEVYLLRRKGLQFQDILEKMAEKYGDEAPSKPILHRWASKESSCTCPWHDWQLLLALDTDVNHARAMSLRAADYDIAVIAQELKVSVELVAGWAEVDYPCFCGSHGWGLITQSVPAVIELRDLVPLTSETTTEARDMAMLAILDATSDAVRRRDVVPKNWRDVLETIKTIHTVLSERGPGVTPGKAGVKLSETRTRTISVPTDGTSLVLEEKSKELAAELMAAAGMSPGASTPPLDDEGS
jgi:hypothetical protein